MELWALYTIISIVAVIIELFAPSMFCINFAIGGIITAFVSIFWGNLGTSLLLFLLTSILSIFLARPLLLKLIQKDAKADFKSQYVEKIVKVIEPVSTTKGAVSIYDERWEARLKYEGEEIPAGSDVKIVGHDSLILFVERV
ncbi:NfeD family protein [bacterium]|nr:NfeD family protein [bacterium]